MKQIKSVIAHNITALRRAKGLTQLELADQLHYSDKAISKWERAQSVPDVTVLVEIADLFGVPLDYLVREHEEDPDAHTFLDPTADPPVLSYRRESVTAVSILLVWLIAMTVFVFITMFDSGAHKQWMTFLFAVPVSLIVWLVFNSIWFNRRFNYVIISLLMWSVIVTLHVSLSILPISAGLLYLLGIPGQVIIIVWALIRKPAQKAP